MTFLALRAFLGRIPRQVWYALAIAAALFFAWHWYSGQIRDAEKRGEDRAYAAVAKKAREVEAKAKKLGEKIAQDARNRLNEQNRRIAADADALRLHGPGKAAYTRCPATTAPTNGPVRAAPETSAPVAPVPDRAGEQFIVLPFAPTVKLIENHDKCLADLSAWERDWYPKVLEVWPKPTESGAAVER